MKSDNTIAKANGDDLVFTMEIEGRAGFVFLARDFPYDVFAFGGCVLRYCFTSLIFRWGDQCLLFGMTYCTLMLAFEFLVDDVHGTCDPDLRIREFA